MRNNKDLPKCPLRARGRCTHNTDRCGKKERALLPGKYGMEYWGWKVFPFFSPMDCWDMIRMPKFFYTKRRGKVVTRPSKCARCWALDKDSGDIYKYKERPIGKQIQYIKTSEVI